MQHPQVSQALTQGSAEVPGEYERDVLAAANSAEPAVANAGLAANFGKLFEEGRGQLAPEQARLAVLHAYDEGMPVPQHDQHAGHEDHEACQYAGVLHHAIIMARKTG